MKTAFLILFMCFVAVDSWYCGIGPASSYVAWIVAFPATDNNYINNCCLIHDQQYDRIDAGTTYLTKEQSDLYFEECLDRSEHLYTRHFVSTVFTVAVKTNTLFEKLKCIFIDC